MYHRAGLLSRSIHFFEGARSKFEQAYKSAPGLAEGLLLYALVRIISAQYVPENVIKIGCVFGWKKKHGL